jgi:tRNA threonylcarbamoyladenosine modification (KEOPS) complex Cgi121 subunit
MKQEGENEIVAQGISREEVQAITAQEIRQFLVENRAEINKRIRARLKEKSKNAATLS